MPEISIIASNCIIHGWGLLSALVIAALIVLSIQEPNARPVTWWLFLVWCFLCLSTWITGSLVPAKTFAFRIVPITPPKCLCGLLSKPGKFIMMRFHNCLAVASIIIAVTAGIKSSYEQSDFAKFSLDESVPLNSTETNLDRGSTESQTDIVRILYLMAFVVSLLLVLLRLSLTCCLYIMSDERDTRFSGLLPGHVSRSQVAKFHLDRHKMIYAEKRRQSMPAVPRLSDIPEASESQVSSRNQSKLSSSVTDFPAVGS
ncbi:Oidioi.mRNA.OKI2018_I69.chr1.g3752.t1.cds [Oikopleura dioica]|uniref:Oidioi.mRNA.OKI2018_I69.chr1.g3752.t1.cds n=1 Tax=Oikopleura dioica TaxID=34765 RepID=A0ABN7SZE1_OIKDI|nr:Oidioi.mRNA.OKI2018_I69.chr1.g3752.t1.cds [Oikopleura dioica]